MNLLRKYAAILLTVAALLTIRTAALAEVTLPEGAVKGLPEKITAMDSAGRSVSSETGEYFFLAEDMTFGEVYTKEIQLMNLCDDKAYHIYFYVEPIPRSKKGEIDLEENCVCSFYLDGVNFYQGSVTGAGNIDLTKEIQDLGYYEPGDAHKLSCSIAWVNESGDYFIDEGHKLVDKTGTWILTPRNGDDQISGEIEFKWIFCAAVDEDYEPPNTGLLAADGSFFLWCMAAVGVTILIVIVLLIRKKKGSRKHE